jgi:low affinity Fe/Cu permease
MSSPSLFTRVAKAASTFTGRPTCFALALAVLLAWAISGPMFGFSDTWQLVINTGTTIITFLMVFLIQNTQNRDSEAMHAKLDELILTSAAENEFVGIEELTDKELQAMHQRCAKAAASHQKLHRRLSQEVDRRKAELAKSRGRARKPATRKAA